MHEQHTVAHFRTNHCFEQSNVPALGWMLFVLVLTVVCFLSSCNPLFEAGFAFSLPGIPIWTGIQLIVVLCVNLDSASLITLVIVFKSSFLLLSMFTVVKESVCIVILSLVSLAFSRATRKTVISASSTDAESLSLIIIYSSLCITAADTRVPSLEQSV